MPGWKRLLNGYYTFAAPWGYKYQKQEGGGNLLVRDEPVASYIQEVFEGLASGRFQSKTEVARFLTSCPEFKKGSNGQVHTSRVENMLPRVLYGGMIERPDWGISLRPGKHEGLVSFETFLKANERVNGKAYAPARADLSEDFPLRGAVRCASCGHSMTANWSTSKSGKRHAYYLCFKKGCADYRKSIKRAEIEGAFEDLLKSLAPAPSLKELITAMFKDAWTMQQARTSAALKSVTEKIKAIEGEMDGLVDRLLKTSNERVVRACENRIDVLERDKAAMQEKLGQSGKPKRSFEEVFELTLGFLSNPWNLWKNGKISDQKTVLRLVISEPLSWKRGEGFQTPVFSNIFNKLEGLAMPVCQMAERKGFEPSIRDKPYTPLAGERLQPLGHLSAQERGGYQTSPLSAKSKDVFSDEIL